MKLILKIGTICVLLLAVFLIYYFEMFTFVKPHLWEIKIRIRENINHRLSLIKNPNSYTENFYAGLNYIGYNNTKAYKLLMRARKIDPNKASAYFGLSQYYANIGKFEEATKYYNKFKSIKEVENQEDFPILDIYVFYLYKSFKESKTPEKRRKYYNLLKRTVMDKLQQEWDKKIK